MTGAGLVDLGRLVPYLEAHLQGFRGPVSARKFARGQSNPTFLVDAASGRYVLRRKPTGTLLKSAHAVEREHRVMAALAGTPVPAPKVHHLCEDASVLGTAFFVMEYLDGRIFWDPALPEIARGDRAAYYAEMARVLGELARLDTNAAGLADYGRPGGYVERQISRWVQQYRASETETVADMEDLIGWLTSRQVADAGVSLVHGDVRFDNVVFHPEAPRIIGMLDWELSTLGTPLVDITYFCTMLRLPRTSQVKGLAGLDRAAFGIPSEDAFLRDFLVHSRLAGEIDWPFWIAFHAFRFAAISQGVKKRRIDGNASSASAAGVGDMVAVAARLGLEAAKGR
ncbi:MAG: phosphotransferase family protein [Alphaproteobacteria bacterium]|nr:phosphotransferase family protein [Alphaproteobacteria bacterium]